MGTDQRTLVSAADPVGHSWRVDHFIRYSPTRQEQFFHFLAREWATADAAKDGDLVPGLIYGTVAVKAL